MSRVSVRYIIDDVPAAMRFYTTLLGFTVERDASPAFVSVVRDGVRLLLSGDGSSGKRSLPDGRAQVPGGWNRVHLEVSDLAAESRGSGRRAFPSALRTSSPDRAAPRSFSTTPRATRWSCFSREAGAPRIARLAATSIRQPFWRT